VALCPIEQASSAQRIPIARPPDAGVHIEQNLSVLNVERPNSPFWCRRFSTISTASTIR